MIKESVLYSLELMKEAKKYLKSIDSGKDSEEVGLIEEVRTSSRNVVTGKTSSKWNPLSKSAIYNLVKMDIGRLEIFKTSNYLAGI